MFSYCVKCEFSDSESNVAEQWLAWLRDEHLADVIAGGALDAKMFRMDTETGKSYEIRYAFRDRDAFQNYLENHAPALREEGLRKFPLALGLSYSRSVGECIHHHR